MRFILYFAAFAFVLNTLGYVAEGDVEMAFTGAVISGLTIWWAKAVRDKRRRKLGLPVKPKEQSWLSKLNANFPGSSPEKIAAARADLQATKDEIKKSLSEIREDAKKTKAEIEGLVKGAKEEFQQKVDQAKQVPVEQPSVPVLKESDVAAPQGEQNQDVEVTDSTSQETEAAPAGVGLPGEQLETAPERPDWRDASGRSLHVGARVTFVANSKGQPVSIPGLLLGERDGKALIEVQSGALLPKNDYVIPWNVVRLSD